VVSQILPKGIQDLLPAKPPNPPLPRAIARVVRARRKGAVLYYDFGGRILLPPPFRSYVIDKSGNNGVLKNGAHIEDGKLVLDGIDDHVKVSDSDSLDITEAITISLRIKLNSVKDQDILWKSGAYMVGVWSGGHLNFALRSGGDWYYARQKSWLDSGKVGKWIHITCSANAGSKMHIYVNGREITYDKQDTLPAAGIDTTSNNLLLGKMRGQGYVHGLIDKVSIYNRALTEKEINEIYKNTKPGFSF